MIKSLAYLAAFVDADGTIYNLKREDGTTCNWRVEACQSVQNCKDGNPLEAMQSKWGGSLRMVGDMWKWTASGLEAAIALQDMLPHLVVKKVRAEIALAFLWRRWEKIMKRIFK